MYCLINVALKHGDELLKLGLLKLSEGPKGVDLLYTVWTQQQLGSEVGALRDNLGNGGSTAPQEREVRWKTKGLLLRQKAYSGLHISALDYLLLAGQREEARLCHAGCSIGLGAIHVSRQRAEIKCRAQWKEGSSEERARIRAHHGEGCRALASLGLHNFSASLLDSGSQSLDLLLSEAHLGIGLFTGGR